MDKIARIKALNKEIEALDLKLLSVTSEESQGIGEGGGSISPTFNSIKENHVLSTFSDASTTIPIANTVLVDPLLCEEALTGYEVGSLPQPTCKIPEERKSLVKKRIELYAEKHSITSSQYLESAKSAPNNNLKNSIRQLEIDEHASSCLPSIITELNQNLEVVKRNLDLERLSHERTIIEMEKLNKELKAQRDACKKADDQIMLQDDWLLFLMERIEVLEEQVKLQSPLFNVGVSVRRRHFERVKQDAISAGNIVIQNASNEDVIRAGNQAAHWGNVAADSSLFELGFCGSQSEHLVFNWSYHCTPESYSSRISKYPDWMKRAVNLDATLRGKNYGPQVQDGLARLTNSCMEARADLELQGVNINSIPISNYPAISRDLLRMELWAERLRSQDYLRAHEERRTINSHR